MTSTALNSSEPNDYGFKLLFEALHEEMRRAIGEAQPEKSDQEIDLILIRVNDYVMKRLHSKLWSKSRIPTKEDHLYKAKISTL